MPPPSSCTSHSGGLALHCQHEDSSSTDHWTTLERGTFPCAIPFMVTADQHGINTHKCMLAGNHQITNAVILALDLGLGLAGEEQNTEIGPKAGPSAVAREGGATCRPVERKVSCSVSKCSCCKDDSGLHRMTLQTCGSLQSPSQSIPGSSRLQKVRAYSSSPLDP